ncbi:Cilia- and flagella-associated protein 46 [Aphanomyces cochlioides]|nr:Cilia- and flagella-associated protein 46 [Aphanomyces cochlioides]
MLLPILLPSAATTTRQLKSSKKSKRQDDAAGEPSLEWWHLDWSLRILVMLAMAARSFDERLEYILAALGHVHAIWQALEEELFVVQCRQAYDAAAAVDTAPKEEFEAWKSHTTVAKSFIVPESTRAWSSFDWESALPALCGHAPLGKTSKVLLNASNVTQPTLSLFYLMKLVDFAMEFHQEPHAVPCLVLAKALSASSSSSSAATTLTELPLTPILVDLKLAIVFDQLGCTDGGQSCLKRVIDAFRMTHDSDGAAAALKKAAGESLSTRRHRVVLSSRPNLMALSAKVAEHLLDLGFHAHVKRLLELTATQCAGDLMTLAQVDFCRGQLCLVEGHVAAALHHFQMACDVDGIEVLSYAKYISTYAAALGRHGQLKLAKSVLQQAIAAVTELPNLPPLSQIQRQLVPSAPLFVDLDIVDALATLRAAYAALLAEESAQAHATGSEWAPLWAESMRRFADSVADLDRVGGNFNMAAIATTWGQLVASKRVDFVADAKDALEFVFQARDAFLQAHAYVESVWMKMDIAPLPLARALAAAKANVASIELLRVRLAQEDTMVVTRMEHEAKKTLVELWLDATAPKKVKTRDDMVVPPLEKALLYWNGAVNLTPAPVYAAGIGQCLRRQLQDDANQDAGGGGAAAVWSFAKEEQRKLGVACATSSPGTAAAPVVDPRQVDCIRFLQETLDAGVKQRDRDAIQACCLELVECFGTRDAASAVKYLLWYQSCRMSAVAEELFLQACDATNRTALFIHRARDLPPTSVSAQLAHVFLEHESEAWRRLGVYTPMEQVLSTVPPLCVLVSLQFSPDMDYLYGAIRGSPSATTPPANAASNAATAAASVAGVHVIARMEFHRPRRLALWDLVAKWKAWRASTVKSLLQYGEAITSSAAMDAFELAAASSALSAASSSQHDEDVLETQFQALLDETRVLLAPLLDALVPSLAKAPPPTTAAASNSSNAADDTASTVVLLVDSALESIPWEALVDAVDSRDFSAHFLSTRWNNLKAAPFKREDFFYVADPYHDDQAEESRHSIAETLHSLKTHLHGLKGVSGADYVPSASEWQHALTSRRGGGFLFYGPNRSLAHFAPALLAGLQATKCNLVVAMSRMETDASFRRQSKLDTHKSKRQLMLEDGYESALLWSLAGVNCVVTNQWNTSFVANHRAVSSLFAWMAKNIPIAKAVKRMGADADKADAKGASNNAVALKGRVRFCPIVYGVPHLG